MSAQVCVLGLDPLPGFSDRFRRLVCRCGARPAFLLPCTDLRRGIPSGGIRGTAVAGGTVLPFLLDELFRTALHAAHAVRSGILDLVAAIVIPPPLLGGVTELRPQAVRPILQAAMDQLLRYGRYLLPDGGCGLRLLLDLIHPSTSPWKRAASRGPPHPDGAICVRGLGSHQFIQPVLREVVHEGYDSTATLDEAAAGVHVGDVGELVVRNVQQPGQFCPVRRRLVEHDEELAVGQHGPGGVGLQEVVHILCDAGAAGPVFADALPEGK